MYYANLHLQGRFTRRRHTSLWSSALWLVWCMVWSAIRRFGFSECFLVDRVIVADNTAILQLIFDVGNIPITSTVYTHHTCTLRSSGKYFWRRTGTAVLPSLLCPCCTICTTLWRSIWLGTASNYKSTVNY